MLYTNTTAAMVTLLNSDNYVVRNMKWQHHQYGAAKQRAKQQQIENDAKGRQTLELKKLLIFPVAKCYKNLLGVCSHVTDSYVCNLNFNFCFGIKLQYGCIYQLIPT